MKNFLTVLIVMSSTLLSLKAVDKQHIPEQLQAAIFYKIIGFNQNLKGDIAIHVIGNPKLAENFKQIIGREIGNATLTKVTSANDLPVTPPDIIYLGHNLSTKEILEYCQKHKIMSLAGKEDLVKAGASLGLTVEKGKPRILLGLKGTRNEKINWKAVIFKLSRVIEE